eukprot:TRINITY_DN6472_c0_g3_i2.p1 TRINITY_DN6472_c0_g3~~TRINITY_DN6472_c0_g3_i2.p1  ORF type:complete len:181 (+),score=54.31 TRINITY_DN6472_c0_g3_i2:133-675(+)
MAASGKSGACLLGACCVALAMLCESLCFVVGGPGLLSATSYSSSSSLGKTVEQYEQSSNAGDMEQTSWLPCLSFLAAVAMGICFGLAAPQATYARGQALQDLGARSVPGSMTWAERLRIEQASMGKAMEEGAITEQKIKEAAISDPKEKRVADAFELMRSIAKAELHPSKELPAYNQSFM